MVQKFCGLASISAASGRAGKAYSSTRASGNKAVPGRVLHCLIMDSACFTASLCLAGRSRRQLIKHGHEALGKITASLKRTHANVERPVVLPRTWSLCAHNDTETRVLRHSLFLAFTDWKSSCQLLAGVSFFSKSITGHWIQSLPSNSGRAHSSRSHAGTT